MTALKDLSTGNGSIAYNGLTFSPLRTYELSGKPVYDRAERAVIGVDYTIEVHALVWADTEDNESAAMSNVRTRLLKPGQTLTISDLGCGDFQINSGSSFVPDINFGPKPRLLHLAPVGGFLAWEIVWVCEFRVSSCQLTGVNERIAAYNYRASYSIDQEGLTTRQIAGYVEIPLTRGPTGGANIGRTADDVWNDVKVSVPVGFRRLRQDRALNEAKNRLEFAVIDQELTGEAFPAGIVEASVDYELMNIPPGFSRFSAALAGTLKVAPGYPYALAPQKFFLILADRLQRLRRAVGNFQEAAVIPTKIRFGRELFGRTSRFAIEFTLVGCLNDILTDGGIWEPLGSGAGGDWQAWAASMAQVWHPRGVAKLFHSPSSDSIVSICDQKSLPAIDDQPESPTSGGGSTGMTIGCGVTEATSYLAYENRVRYFKRENWSEHRLAQAVEVSNPPDSDPFNSVGASIGNYGTGPGARQNPIQTTGTSEERVLMQGKALRLKYEPAIPSLEAIGGARAQEYQRNVEVVAVGNFFGCTLYQARWAILYVIREPTSAGVKLTPAPNRLYCLQN